MAEFNLTQKETQDEPSCINMARYYTTTLRSLLLKYDKILDQINLQKHPAERTWLLAAIDNKLKMASLSVNEDILNLLGNYMERDYLAQPYRELEKLETSDDENDGFKADINRPKF